MSIDLASQNVMLDQRRLSACRTTIPGHDARWRNNGTQPVDPTIADLVDDRKPEKMEEKIM